MLKLSQSLFNQPVVSLRTTSRIGTAIEPIINPHNLKILGWWCQAASNGQRTVLLADDAREISFDGIAVNDEEAFSLPEDLVRQQEVLEINFQLLDKPVKTKRHKLGKVADFSYNDGMFVQKLHVARSLVKVFSSEDTLIIDRTQILEVTDSYILVRDTEVKATAEEPATVPVGAVIS